MAWTVLALVFLDEVLAVVAAGIWGTHVAGIVVGVVVALLVMVAWFMFASPKARFGGPVVRPVVKVIVFTLASAGLWADGHPGWATALFVFSLVINGLAQLPAVRDQAAIATGPPAAH